MDVLLDTSALIWFLEDSPRMPAAMKDLIEHPETRCRVSLVSAWEIAIKTSIGKLKVAYTVEPGLRQLADRNGFATLPIAWEELGLVARLPLHHGDPFDRLLACQSLRHGLTILSPDTAFDAYGVRRLWHRGA